MGKQSVILECSNACYMPIQVGDGSVEFVPTPAESRALVASAYRVPYTMLVQFENDAIDETPDMARILSGVNPSGVSPCAVPLCALCACVAHLGSSDWGCTASHLLCFSQVQCSCAWSKGYRPSNPWQAQMQHPLSFEPADEVNTRSPCMTLSSILN